MTLEVTLLLDGAAEPPSVSLQVATATRRRRSSPDAPTPPQIRRAAAHLLRLDEDLSPFYAAAAADPELAWVTSGAGRMIRSPTVFEEVVKTICTTNCTWSATIRMVSALVEHLGEAAPGATDGPLGHAFPDPGGHGSGRKMRFTLKLSERAIEAST